MKLNRKEKKRKRNYCFELYKVYGSARTIKEHNLSRKIKMKYRFTSSFV